MPCPCGLGEASSVSFRASRCRRRKGAVVPTHVYFSGGSLILEEDFDQVSQQLSEHEAGLFTRKESRPPVRVAVYRSSVAYIEEIQRGEEEVPLAAYAD